MDCVDFFRSIILVFVYCGVLSYLCVRVCAELRGFKGQGTREGDREFGGGVMDSQSLPLFCLLIL